MEALLEALVTGLLVGAVYGLMCAGLGLIFGVMRVINFAHGDFLMLGMYVAFYLLSLTGAHASGLLPFGMAVLAGPIVFVIGALVHRLTFGAMVARPGARQGEDGHHAQLILTLGVALVLQNGALLLFGSEPRTINTALSSSAWELPLPFMTDGVVFINRARLISAALALVLGIALHMAIGATRMGKALRAAADNPEAATYMGIEVTRAHRMAFAGGVAITAVAGGLVATYSTFQPYAGLEYVIIMYTGVVLGGMGSLSGAFTGGVMIGLVQQLSVLVLPPQLQNAAIFAVFLLVMLFKPNGLFGRNVERM